MAAAVRHPLAFHTTSAPVPPLQRQTGYSLIPGKAGQIIRELGNHCPSPSRLMATCRICAWRDRFSPHTGQKAERLHARPETSTSGPDENAVCMVQYHQHQCHRLDDIRCPGDQTSNDCNQVSVRAARNRYVSCSLLSSACVFLYQSRPGFSLSAGHGPYPAPSAAVLLQQVFPDNLPDRFPLPLWLRSTLSGSAASRSEVTARSRSARQSP